MKCTSLFLAALSAASLTGAADFTAVDLSPHVGPSQFDWVDSAWALPVGDHVMDGVPWKISGAIELWGAGSARSGNAARTNVSGIRIDARFAQLHLLGATAWGTDDGTEIAALKLHYADGSEAELPILYGHHVRDWYGPRWGKEDPILDPDTRIAWLSEMASSVQYERGLRFYHSVFDNPFPEKEIASISLSSRRTQSGWMLAALTFGPANAALLPNTYTIPEYLVPNENPRVGKPVALRGRVRTHAEGEAVPGANILITGLRRPNTAAADSGAVDPTDGEVQVTDEAGYFLFERTTDQFNYELTVLADGFAPATYLGADPLRGEIEIRLKPGAARPQGPHFVHVRLEDGEGNAVPAARVQPEGVSWAGSTRWGGSQGFPSITVSDQKGGFMLSRDEPFERLQMNIQARGLAPAKIWLPASNTVQVVKLGVGASITGRVIKDGEPLANVNVGISGQDRDAMVYAGFYETVTDAEGRFVFRSLPPYTRWNIFGLIWAFKPHGVLSPKQVSSPGHGETNEIADLVVREGVKLAGRLVPAAGHSLSTIPLKLYVAFETRTDAQSVDVLADGSFEFEGLDRGLVRIYLNSREWRLSGRNRNLSTWNAGQIEGLLSSSKLDLELEVEPGARRYDNGRNMSSLPAADDPRNRPLSGVEPGPSIIRVAGKVIDEATGNAIKNVEVLTGRQPPVPARPPKPFLQRVLDNFRDNAIPWNERPFWYFGREEHSAGGSFDLEFEVLTSDPMLQISAQGYEPVVVGPIPVSTNGLVVALSKGSGPAGIVSTPLGQPAHGATLIYGASGEQFGFDPEGKLREYGTPEALAQTVASGAFGFPKRLDGQRLFVSHPSGWAVVDAADFGSNMKVRLAMWSSVRGFLVDATGAPMAGETLSLTLDSNWHQTGKPHINFNLTAKTATDGGFLLTNVPPGEIQLIRRVPMGVGPRTGWQNRVQTRFHARPGVTNDLGNVILDTPPPEPLIEQLKQKVGL